MSPGPPGADPAAEGAGLAAEAPRREEGRHFALPVLTAKRFGRIWLIGLLAFFGAAFLWQLRFFVTPVILAAVIAVLAWPLQVAFVRGLRGHAGVAALFSVIVVMLLLVIPMVITFGLVRLEVTRLYQMAEEPFLRWLEGSGEWLALTLASWEETPLGLLLLSEPLRELGLTDIDVASTLRDTAGTAGNLVARVVNRTSSGAFQLLANLFIVLFTMFYFFRDGERIVKRLRYLSPLEERYEQLLVDRLVSVSRATLRGSFVIGLIQGGIGSVTLWLAGVEAPILWGIVMVIMSLVPLLGTWLVMYPIALVQALLGHFWQALLIFLVTSVLISTVDNLLRPRLVGRGSGMHDLVIFFATLGGIAVFGVMGFVVGPILAAITLALVDIYTLEFQPQLERTEPGPAEGMLQMLPADELAEEGPPS